MLDEELKMCLQMVRKTCSCSGGDPKGLVTVEGVTRKT
jgi:hypothetical protein